VTGLPAPPPSFIPSKRPRIPMPRIRPFRIAAAFKLHDPDAPEVSARLVGEGSLDGLQVYVRGPLQPADIRALDAYAALETGLVVHAPHHQDGVNPVEPTAPGDLSPDEGKARLEAGMTATLEAADRLEAEWIVAHTGCLVRRNPAEGLEAMSAFLDTWSDPRLILENLPAIGRDVSFTGTSAGDLLALGGGRVSGFCLDLAHLYVAANHFGWDYPVALAAFDHLPVVYQHLSNSPRGSPRDRHTPLDSPDGGVPFEHAIAWIAVHPQNTTCLEYKTAGGGVYDAQLAAFDALYRRHAPLDARAALRDLQRCPGIGPSMARDLIELGIRSVDDLRGRDPEELYAGACEQRGVAVDRCVLYAFRCAVYFSETSDPDPDLLRWWRWKDR